VGWELEIFYNSIEPCWESGCGGILWIEMLCGDWWSTLNIIVQGVVWCSEEVVGSFGVGVWKHIRRGWEKFSTFACFDVGIESKVSFWHDI
jgi:hypothetical protein